MTTSIRSHRSAQGACIVRGLASIAIVAMVLGAAAQDARAAKAPKMDPELKLRITEVLTEALNSRDALAQGRALYALVEMGDKAAKTRAGEALAEENWGILRYALLLAAEGKKPAKGFQKSMLRAMESTTTRPQALALIAELPPGAADAVLREALGREASLRDEILDRMVDRGDARALAVIGHALRHKDAKVREAAQKTIPKVSGKEAGAFLMGLAGGRGGKAKKWRRGRSKAGRGVADKAVRDAALQALLKSRDPAVVPFLTEQLKSATDRRFRMEVARALAGRGQRDLVLPGLKEALDDEDTEVRARALEGIAALGDRVVAASLRGIATNEKESPRVSIAALAVLGGSGDIANLDTLRAALTTDHIHMRVGATRAMGLMKRREAIPDLARALVDGNRDVREAAAEALGLIGGPEVVPHLERSVGPEVDRAVRRNIIEALGRSGDPTGVQALQVLLASRDPVLMGSAVDAMLEIGDPSAVPTLLLAVDPRYPEVLEKGVKAICLLDEAQGQTVLTAHLLRLSLGFVHELNSEAGPRAVVFLQTIIEQGTPSQRELALTLLLRRGEKGLAIVRKAAKGNSDRGVKRSALQALASRADKPAFELFVEALTAADAGVKGIALEALAQFPEETKDEAVRAKIEKLMEDRAPSVRVAAAHALLRLAS